jgi:hypothetical protein
LSKPNLIKSCRAEEEEEDFSPLMGNIASESYQNLLFV